jgi:hypothetical protein
VLENDETSAVPARALFARERRYQNAYGISAQGTGVLKIDRRGLVEKIVALHNQNIMHSNFLPIGIKAGKQRETPPKQMTAGSIYYGYENSRFLPSASRMTISNPDFLSSSEAAVYMVE